MLKYKNTLLQADKKDWIQTEVNTPSLESGLIDANNEVCAFVSGSSTGIGICKYKTSGKVVPLKYSTSSAISVLRWANDRALYVGTNSGVEVLELNEANALSKIKTYTTNPVLGLNLHPSVQSLAAIGNASQIDLFDLENGCSTLKIDLNTKFEDCDWNLDGKTLAFVGMDKELGILDPRVSVQRTALVKTHMGLKKSNILWCGSSRLISTGLSSSRERGIDF